MMRSEATPKPVDNAAYLSNGGRVGLDRKPKWYCLIPVTALLKRRAKGEDGFDLVIPP